MTRVIVLSLVWTIAFVVVLFGTYFGPSAEMAMPQGPAVGGPAGGVTSSYAEVETSLAVVTAIFFLDIIVMWALTKIGGEKLKADVKATINKFGGSIVIAGAGLVGCFLAIAFVAFGGFYLVATVLAK